MRAGTLFALLFLLQAAPATAGPDARFLMGGDILLSRLVADEISRTGRSPWREIAPLLHEADWVAANLEGAVGAPERCVAPGSGCFAVSTRDLAPLAAAGFRALGVENNHAGDLGRRGREETEEALRALGLDALSLDRSPAFVRLGETTLAVVTCSTIGGRDGGTVAIPSPELRQRLRLARGLANLVAVFVHWGNELQDWPSESQRQAAAWLIRHGADLVVGHHPHVVQEPACVLGRPVFFSLGNLLFDQKYPLSQRGLVADCRVAGGRLHCEGRGIERAPGTFAPRPVSEAEARGGPLDGCDAPLHAPLAAGGLELAAVREEGGDALALVARGEGRVRWQTRPVKVLSAEVGRLAGPEGPELLLTLERHPSPIDGEVAPRPYVYELTSTGPVARWRGSALAWPLVDAALLPGGRVLCAEHRGDSFLVPDSQIRARRVMAYTWNGFGFSGVSAPDAERECAELFDLSPGPAPATSGAVLPPSSVSR